ncbi:hypothetical protein ACWXVL_00870 [Mycoplasma sp. 128]
MERRIDDSLAINDIFINPTKTFFETNESKLGDIFDDFINERIKQFDPEAANKVTSLRKEILDKKVSIEKLYQHLNIGGKRFGNIMIILSCFILIGFIFLAMGIYRKNCEAIESFENEKQKAYKEADNLRIEKEAILCSVFNTFSPEDLRSYAFSKIGINKVEVTDWSDLKPVFADTTNPVFIHAVQKYDIRNTYFYDIFYRVLTYEPIEYTGSIVVSYRNGDKTYSKTIVAYYQHTSPFLKSRSLFLYPSNYLPELSFISQPLESERKIRKTLKKSTVLLENRDFYQHFNLEYNNDVAFVNFFQMLIQQRYIDWKIYSQKLNLFTPDFEKKPTAFLINNWNINDAKFYSELNYNAVENIRFEESDIDRVKKALWPFFYTNMSNLLASINFVFQNKYLAAEKYTKPGQRYQMDYKDDQIVSNPVDTKLDDTLIVKSKIYKETYLEMYSKERLRPIIYEIDSQHKSSDTSIFNIIATSWYGIEKVEYVRVYDHDCGTVNVPVPYTDYTMFKEPKIVLFNSKIRLEKGQMINSGLVKKTFSRNNATRIDQQLIDDNRMYFNYHFVKNEEKAFTTTRWINNFNRQFNKYKDTYKLEINEHGIFVFIDKPDKLEKSVIDQMAAAMKL